MKILRWLVLFLFFLPGTGRGQIPDFCPCSQNLDSVYRHLRENYPGFGFKNAKGPDFEKHLSLSRTEASASRSPKECGQVMNRFLKWFGDGHLGVSYSGDVFKPKKVRLQDTPVWPGLTEIIARQYLDSLSTPDSLEGIWESYESFYKVLIAKTPDRKGYRAWLIQTINRNWQPGEVKMDFFPDDKGKLVCTFYTSDHSPEQPDFTLNKNLLEINKITVWNRIHPATKDPVAVESFVSARYKGTQEFRPWDKEVFYVQLQNISAGVKPLIDSLVRLHRAALRTSKTLILDLRDNEGGDLTVFDSFWPFILTGRAVLFGTKYLCTPANLQAYAKQVAEMEGQIDPEFRNFSEEMQRHRGELWEIPNDTLLPDTVARFPERVVLLVNENCKSSTEDFILAARASRKVVVAGQRTGGVADFEETVDVGLPCPELILFHPIGISNRLPENPLDGKGITPDLVLPSKSKAWQPWVREVLRKLKSKNP
jgi:hypothetical protein